MPQIKLRLTEPLRESIEAAAREAKTSMNSEMNRRLEKSFQEDRLAKIEREIKDLWHAVLGRPI